MPDIKGLSETFARITRSYGVKAIYKPHTTLRNLLVHPKDKIAPLDTCGCVYEIGCSNCNQVYIGETARKFSKRLDEHVKDVEKQIATGVRTRANRASTSGAINKSAITDHASDLNHVPKWADAKVVLKESTLLDRQIKEAMTIRKTLAPMNRDKGAYKLPHTYDDLLIPRRGPDDFPNRTVSGSRTRMQ